jgi:hypothetical protein
MTEQEQIRVLREALKAVRHEVGGTHPFSIHSCLPAEMVERIDKALAATATTQPVAAAEPIAHSCPCCPVEIRNLHAVAHNVTVRMPTIYDGELKRAVEKVQPLMDAHFANRDKLTTPAAAPVQAATDLSSAILNLQCNDFGEKDSAAYRYGHLDARRAASELAASVQAATDEVRDAALLNDLDKWREAEAKRGFHWSSINIDMDKPVRWQLAEALKKTLRTTSTDKGDAA